jgi:preprotein translocase subunit YajC
MSFIFNPLLAQAAGSDVPVPSPVVTGTQVTTDTAGAREGDPNAQKPADWSLPLMLLLFFLGFYFLFMRPQAKQQKEIARRQSELKNGDQVVTSAGILGKVVGIDGDRVTLQVSEGVRIPFQRAAIVGFPAADKDAKPYQKK